MSRTRSLFALVSLFLATSVLAKSHTPAKNTHAAIKSYVHAAAKVVAAKGADCTTLGNADWKKGDYYVFVVGPDGKLICHPTLAGKTSADVVDATGRKIGEEIVAAGKEGNGKWVEYVWPRPGTTNPVAKSTFAKGVKGPDGKWYVVGSGGYEVK